MNTLATTLYTFDPVYNSPEYMQLMEDSLTYFKQLNTTKVVPVNAQFAYRSRFDFFRLLNDMGLDQKYHWVVARVNGMTNPMMSTEKLTQVIVPDIKEIERLVALMQTKKGRVY